MQKSTPRGALIGESGAGYVQFRYVQCTEDVQRKYNATNAGV